MAKGTSKRGFASMDKEKQRQAASKGGKRSRRGNQNTSGEMLAG